jgi:transposase
MCYNSRRGGYKKMNWTNQSQQASFYLQMMEKRIKNNDILHIIDEKIDFSFIDQLCQPYYSQLGPIGYSPERLFRMLIVMYLDNIRSERQLSEKLNDSIRYMWFCKIDLDNPVPDHSTFSVLRSRLGDNLFKEIFNNILSQMLDLGIIEPKSISVDSTSVLADVKMPSKKDKNVKCEGKQTISPHDPDARYGHTSPKKGFFGYKAQMMVDNDSGVILNTDVQPGSFDDKSLNPEFIKEPLKNHNLQVQEAALDRGFDSYAVRRTLKKEKIKAAIPLKGGNDHGVYTIARFQINLKNKTAVCPADQPMNYRGFDHKRHIHEFIGTACENCHLKTQCTTVKTRRLAVHQDYRIKQLARTFNQTLLFKEISKKRSCVERINAEAKRFHGLVRARFRRLWKIKIQSFLTAIAINLKRVAKFYLQAPQIRLTEP